MSYYIDRSNIRNVIEKIFVACETSKFYGSKKYVIEYTISRYFLLRKKGEEMGQVRRGVNKYLFKVGNRVKHIGFTSDLSRREKELRAEDSMGHIRKVGRITTRDAARRWAKEKQ